MIAPMKWEAYRRDDGSARYVIHAEVDAGPFVFHRYGSIDEFSLCQTTASEIFKETIKQMNDEITTTVHRIRDTLGRAVDDYFLKGA